MRKVLIIDDQEDLLEEMADILILEKFNVWTAKDAGSGMELMNTIKPDLVLCDIIMPDFSGFELFSRVKSNMDHWIPFVFVTAKCDLETFREGMSLGADLYLIKPFSGSDLLNLVSRVFHKINMIDQITRDITNQSIGSFPFELKENIKNVIGFSEAIRNKSQNNSNRHYSFFLSRKKSKAKPVSGQECLETIKTAEYIYNNARYLSEQIDRYLFKLKVSVSDHLELVCVDNISPFIDKVLEETKIVSESDIRLNICPASCYAEPVTLLFVLKEILVYFTDHSEHDKQILLSAAPEKNSLEIFISNGRWGLITSVKDASVHHFNAKTASHTVYYGEGMDISFIQKAIELQSGSVEFYTENTMVNGVRILLPIENISIYEPGICKL